MRAITDSGPTEMNQKKPEPIENLFTLMNVVSSTDTFEYFNDKYNTCEIRYGEMKKQLAEDIIKFNQPILDKIKELSNDVDFLRKVTTEGAEKARESAIRTLKEARKIIGFKAF